MPNLPNFKIFQKCDTAPQLALHNLSTIDTLIPQTQHAARVALHNQVSQFCNVTLFCVIF